jgi:hypothetical protein
MQEIAKVLAGCGELGPGAVFRAVRETQRRLVRQSAFLLLFRKNFVASLFQVGV